MSKTLLVDGNNLGHALGYIDSALDQYDTAGLLRCLDGVIRYLDAQGQPIEIVLFLDDPSAAKRLGGWHVQVAPVPSGNADAAIRRYAQQHAARAQILVSGDRDLCDDVTLWGVVCLSPNGFVSHYLAPAQEAGFLSQGEGRMCDEGSPVRYEEIGEEPALPVSGVSAAPYEDQGQVARQEQLAALGRAEAQLRGEDIPPPEVYTLKLERWEDAADFALYLAENHLCPQHPELTDPAEMIDAIQQHCSLQPRYFTSGRVIHRVFRLFLCRPEHSLSLDDLTRLAKTRRRKIRAAIEKYGEALGIVVKW
jgi:hypothetical protein